MRLTAQDLDVGMRARSGQRPWHGAAGQTCRTHRARRAGAGRG